MSRIAVLVAILFCLFVCGAQCYATTKGLNQIVTPDVMPQGVLSLSIQQQDPNIANRYEAQVEYGVTKTFEFAVFEGSKPGETILNVEQAFIQHGPYLLSTGFANWSSRGDAPAPYLEAGYYKGLTKTMLGVERNGGETQSILGYAYQIHPRVLLQIDYQSGAANSLTGGFTYSITPELQFNPALYLENGQPHHAWGYAVLTWNIKVAR